MNMRSLQKLDPASWTELLATDSETESAVVTAVEAEPFGTKRVLTRYWLTLENHTERITLMAKKTSAVEALFYRDLSSDVAALVPRVWFTDTFGSQGWIVMDEMPHDRPVLRWDADDIEDVLHGLVGLHMAYWDQDNFLRTFPWLPHFRDKLEPSAKSMRYEAKVANIISEHALNNFEFYGPQMIHAARGLKAMMQLKSWPGVFDGRHIRAAADLLDDPMPIMDPLRAIPTTLVHGNLQTRHWHLTLFRDCRLFDWRSVYIGPAVMDLVEFVSSLEQIRVRRGEFKTSRAQELFEQTTLDGYFLTMSQRLNNEFVARGVRHALPAGRCLHILINRLPFFADWVQQLQKSKYDWQTLKHMDDEQLNAEGLTQLAGARTFLTLEFSRFLQIYRTL